MNLNHLSIFHLVNVRYGKEGKLCTDDGFRNILDFPECKKAADTMEKSFAHSQLINVPDFPKGCFFNINDEIVHFNGHETGKRHSEIKPICMQSNGK